MTMATCHHHTGLRPGQLFSLFFSEHVLPVRHVKSEEVSNKKDMANFSAKKEVCGRGV